VNGHSDNPHELADELEREADQLQRHSDELGEKVAEVRQDWERKRRDQAVPGAPALEGATEQDSPASAQVSEEGRRAPADREADDAPAEESG
jgi:hypothetical protein